MEASAPTALLKPFSVAQVATMLDCTERSVEDCARSGRLPGIKFGVSWIFPYNALLLRLDELALEGARQRWEETRGPELKAAAAAPPPGRRSRV